MAEIVEFKPKPAQAAAASDAHIEGPARCWDCKHDWQAVAPVGATWLTCPCCGSERATFSQPIFPNDDRWRCRNCETTVFHVCVSGIYCPICGAMQRGFNQ